MRFRGSEPDVIAAIEYETALVPGTRRCLGTLGAMEHRRRRIEAKRDEIHEVVRRHRGRSVALFGSVARGDDSADSDIDFLVEFEPGSSLFDLMDLQEALAELLGERVDVVSVGGLKERDDHIRREAVPI